MMLLRLPMKKRLRLVTSLNLYQEADNDNPVRVWIDIRISNGMHLSQKNLSYQDLVRMIEKLEGLC